MLPLVDFRAARGYPWHQTQGPLAARFDSELPPTHATWGSTALFWIMGDPDQLFLRLFLPLPPCLRQRLWHLLAPPAPTRQPHTGFPPMANGPHASSTLGKKYFLLLTSSLEEAVASCCCYSLGSVTTHYFGFSALPSPE